MAMVAYNDRTVNGVVIVGSRIEEVVREGFEVVKQNRCLVKGARTRKNNKNVAILLTSSIADFAPLHSSRSSSDFTRAFVSH
jgi:hypothetical protein